MAALDLEGFQPCAAGQGSCVFVPAAVDAPERAPRGKVAAGSSLRAITWKRPDRKNGKGKAKWPRLIEQGLERLQRAADAPKSAPARLLFTDSTPLPGRARDGRDRDQRQRSVRSEARENTANVMSVILGWTDIVSGIVAAKPSAGRTDWEHKSWNDVGRVAFGQEDVEGELCVEKRTARAVARLAGLGLIEVTQIREHEGEKWRSRVAVKRVTQLFWAKLGLLSDLFRLVNARKQEQKDRRAAAKEAATHAGERARQRGEGGRGSSQPLTVAKQVGSAVEPAHGPPARRELPQCALDLVAFLGIEKQ